MHLNGVSAGLSGLSVTEPTRQSHPSTALAKKSGFADQTKGVMDMCTIFLLDLNTRITGQIHMGVACRIGAPPSSFCSRSSWRSRLSSKDQFFFEVIQLNCDSSAMNSTAYDRPGYFSKPFYRHALIGQNRNVGLACRASHLLP